MQGNILTPSLDYISAQERVDVMERVASLPVTLSRSIIQDAIDTHDIVIIQAETGSGKSTQVPQILREMYP